MLYHSGLPRSLAQQPVTVRRTRTVRKFEKPLVLPATESGPQPGDFAIGSDKSKAAARMLAPRKENSEFKIQVNTNIPRVVFPNSDT
jgi:hypothetical protein